MANSEHVAILRDGVMRWNAWRSQNPGVQPDLRSFDITELATTDAEVRIANAEIGGHSGQFTRLNLNGAILTDARLVGAVLTRATMRNAEASGATVSMAKLMLVDFRGANLRGADFCGSDMRMADLSDACLSDAKLGDNIFGGTKLRGADGLESCVHISPSTIDLRTLALSGPLPASFLRGCGLPDRIIDYLPSLLQQPIQFNSCFISYSSKDQNFASRLHADLQARGVRCWFAPHDVLGGRKLHEQIVEAIHLNDRLLLILSEYSMNSDWVATEIALARKREMEQKRQVLFPIAIASFDEIRAWKCFDADVGKDSAKEIREYFIPDFSRWKEHDFYCSAFERLAKSLIAQPKLPKAD